MLGSLVKKAWEKLLKKKGQANVPGAGQGGGLANSENKVPPLLDKLEV